MVMGPLNHPLKDQEQPQEQEQEDIYNDLPDLVQEDRIDAVHEEVSYSANEVEERIRDLLRRNHHIPIEYDLSHAFTIHFADDDAFYFEISSSGQTSNDNISVVDHNNIITDYPSLTTNPQIAMPTEAETDQDSLNNDTQLTTGIDEDGGSG